jgi:transglutaminase-like putative cysteine protease
MNTSEITEVTTIEESNTFEPTESSEIPIITTAEDTTELTETPTTEAEPTESSDEIPITTEKPTEIPALNIMIEPGKTAAEIYEFNLINYNAQGTDKIIRDFYLLPSYMIQSKNQQIIDTAVLITDGISNEYDKLKAIYLWVANNTWVDLDYKNGNDDVKTRRRQENPEDAVNTLNSKVGMCVNYANLTSALCRAINIPAKVITIEPSGHTFCEAFVDSKWIIMDNYFDSNNKYEYSKVIQSGICGDRFFDITVKDMWDLSAYYLKQRIDFIYYVESKYFYGETSLESITIRNGYYAIYPNAFYGCENLKEIYIPSSVTFISKSAFVGCPNLIIYCRAGSYAEMYAKAYNIKFITE